MTHLNTGPAEQSAEVTSFVSGYRPRPGTFDELMNQDGRVRPHWQSFVATLANLGSEEINRRFAAADRHLRDSGVFYRVHEDPTGAERPWPFSHVPLIIDAQEWRQLVPGLIQRAQLLEAVLADAYGARELVMHARLPAALIAGNPEFLRPLVGAKPAGGAYLRFYAVDLARSTAGEWWVLGDRTQAPSGAGYALESRIALTRAMPDVYRALNVERLAPFFQAFQAELAQLNRRDDSRICLLTPGPLNESYFEHAYLARYLGFLLVEGEDLTVREDGVFVRTVSGLRRAEVLLRRLDADFADPLELNARSHLGVPGLVQAVRDGSVAIVNALGTGLVEARGFLGFLSALAPALTGRELSLSNMATRWLGDAARRETIMQGAEGLVIASAFAGDVATGGPHSEQPVANLDPDTRTNLISAIARRPIDFVAQEPVSLATMPVWRGGTLVPRPFVLRVFLARVGEGWKVMPGGFVRVAEDADARAVSLQQGGRTADAWVVAEGPVAPTSLLPTPDRIEITRTLGVLPSRAADNLFWVGRYVERSEATLRLVRALIARSTERDDVTAAITERIAVLLGAWGAAPSDLPRVRPALIAGAALQRRDLSGSLPRLVAAARSAASVIRDRFSPDAWRALNDLLATIETKPSQFSETVLFEQVNAALRIIASFSGLAQENMSRLAGWRFLELGRRIERAIATCRFVRQFADGESLDGALDVLLELCDSQITYRARYVMVAAQAPVIDLVVLDPNNPRSIVYQLDRIEAHLATLPKRNADGRLSLAQQIALSAATALRTTDAANIAETLIADTEDSLMKLSEAISAAYFTPYERFEVAWEALA
jgi:uncharacterized circularly permuted ATP-grasp superfamily protein/uncharacterized alpha-E superfamily protein